MKAMGAMTGLEIRQLHTGYPGGLQLDIEYLQLHQGQITAIIGSNGSGKSTLLQTVLGMHRYTGEIRAGDLLLGTADKKARARRIAYLPQQLQAAAMDVETLVCHGRFPFLGISGRLGDHDRELVGKALDITEMQKLKNQYLTALSGGERQRAYLAMVIAQDADMVLLDEPDTYMDLKHQMLLTRILMRMKEEGKGVVLTSHDLARSFSVSDRICLLEQGKIIADGSAEAVAGQQDALKRMFGACVRRSRDAGRVYPYELVRGEELRDAGTE